MRKLLLLFIFIPFLSNAQDLTGFWKGKIYQDSGGYAPEYVLELNLIQKKKRVSGTSLAYLGKVVVAKLYLDGYISKDSIYLSEFSNGIIEKILPPTYLICIKNFTLGYKKTDFIETLSGRWDGKAFAKDNLPIDKLFTNDTSKKELDVIDCIPGKVLVSRNDGLQIEASQPTELYNYPDTLYGTHLIKVKEIEIENPVIEISISDYEKIDGDKVSIYFNREKIADHLFVRKSPTNFTLTLSGKYINNEIIIVAENLGRIPPNTSLMKVKDGNKSYDVYVSSDFNNSAAIYLKFKK
ncbi:MAG: hypothetical protein KJ712_03245 [Bacteroidetes bacterium]|nr:hypothetical protein [Bacteroidota bacterium]MBU1484607.1 hypothetical protein [Bacteroidota bacterium]MBU2045729.1 hypothetical protein [Bacteroidota bacterium]MBU2269065.1 hypothetical protein [Bacteroidota bacterium]MBU2376001.1 hypothetical protein [Bacteroidota bacterium]